MRPVLIDCDPGADDALAIFMALNSADLDVVGLTTVGGNASLADTTRNALGLLEAAGRSDVPVWRGADRPLDGDFTFAYEVHGAGGLGVQLAPPSADIRPEPAADAIAALSAEHSGELTLIALGPLTNVAHALQSRPALARECAQVLIMGGALGVPGNITEHAEFNIYNDPPAAALVFACGAPLALVGLDVTTAVKIDRTAAPWSDGATATARLAGRIFQSWAESHPEADGFSLHDPLTVAAAIDPGLISWQSGTLQVESEDPARRGKTTLLAGAGTARAAVAVAVERARAMVEGLVEGSNRTA